MLEQPYEYSARELVEPDWRRLPGCADVTAEQWRNAQWQRAQLREEPPPAARRLRRPARRVVLRRRRGRPGRPRDDVAAAAAADAQHDGAATTVPDDRPRCWPTRCAATCSRSPPTGCPGGPQPPPRRPRLAARARDVGRRGPHPPLPHQGAGRAAVDLPAVLRPLHPHGPGRQLDARSPQAQVRAQAGRPAGGDARLPARAPPASATSSSPAATSPTCRSRTSRRSSPGCWRSSRSATSGWPPRRSWACPSTGCSPTSSRA